ncbi:MAG: DUF2236 domain-containing protein [Chloroflexota bacterium]|nr:DUF2236 domain-containing protein [Chloroflexota bacterium]PLS80713.1 MAG: DUF2236 domain-containing protein [Chloroflexota bacterium]
MSARPDPNLPFTDPNSIVRTIWGNADTILLVFAGSAAEFALNRAVDWLFYTGKVPNDPIGRLFATARFARDIVFADAAAAQRTLDRINTIHRALEQQRQQTIPDWAHRDVLYMLIDYSERAYRLLHRPLTDTEQTELYAVFLRVGQGLQIPELPATYAAWQQDRQRHLEQNLEHSHYTTTLYQQYRRHLGARRYRLLLHIQTLLVPERVRDLLHLRSTTPLAWTLRLYPVVNRLKLRPLLQRLLIPKQHLAEVRQLDAAAFA